MAEARSGASAAEAADHIGVSSVTFGKLLNMGVIERQPRHMGYDLRKVRMARIHQLEALAHGREEGGTLTKQRAKLEAVKTDVAEFKLGLMRGDYVSLEVFAKEYERQLMVMREHFLQLPRVAAEALLPILRSEADMAAAEDVIRERTYEAMDVFADGKVLAAEVRSESRERRDRADDIKEPA
jgi:hypothetical protein